MKKTEDFFTPEQKEQFKDIYVISNDRMHAMICGNKPTPESLVVIDLDWEIVLTAEDFSKDDKYFVYQDEDGNSNYIEEEAMPEEVAVVLSSVIEKIEQKTED